MRESRHDVLFEPIEVRSKVFRNRFYSVPHASFVPGRRLSDIAFRRMKAEGGWAAVCGGVISIRSDSWGGLVPRIWDPDEQVMLGRVATEVKGQGALAGIEFGHGGSRGEGGKFSPSLGVSQLSDPDRGHLVPKEMDLDDILRLQDDWVEAARRAADLGYDIIYAYGGSGTLPAQFISPYFNKRTDLYGGTLENRARFWLELIDRMRSAVGDRCLVAARIASESFSPYGISLEETLHFIRLADDMVDLWDVNVGYSWPPDSAPSRLASEGFQVEWSGRVRSATNKPIIGVGRLTSPDRMAEILRSGVWDFIGGARPGIADPFLPRKIEEGRYDDIRECTGTNFCISVETSGIGLSCVQNSTIGEEYRRGWHPERFARAAGGSESDVLVVGAGPAGMECARVLAERGFRTVHLIDSSKDVGGHLNWLRRLPGLGDWGRIVDYRKVQLRKLTGVEIITGVTMGRDDVVDYGASLVVVATGSRWIGLDDDWHVADLARLRSSALAVLTPESIMVDGVRPQGKVVIWDGDGGAVAVGIAELLAAEGSDVTLATRFDRVAPQLDATFEGGGVRGRLHQLGVTTAHGVLPLAASGSSLVVVDSFGEEQQIEAETLILVAQRVSDDALYRGLVADVDRLTDGGIGDVFRIGDCVAPRHFGFAVADGHRLGREIDGTGSRLHVGLRRERDVDAGVVDFAWPGGGDMLTMM
jgi:dimethylamine/trimethylamine dehydrogenase